MYNNFYFRNVRGEEDELIGYMALHIRVSVSRSISRIVRLTPFLVPGGGARLPRGGGEPVANSRARFLSNVLGRNVT